MLNRKANQEGKLEFVPVRVPALLEFQKQIIEQTQTDFNIRVVTQL